VADDELERVLRLVAQGGISADEAASLLDALDGGSRVASGRSGRDEPRGAAVVDQGEDAVGRALRVLVSDSGRVVVNLRVPLALGRSALDHVPGISPMTADRIRQALESGRTGPILELDEAGSGVRILLE